MSIQLRKGKPVTKDGRRISNKLLQDDLEVERLVHSRDATRFMQPLRGTPSYWEKTLRDLQAMIRQLGNPTFFCTFSAAEMRWPEVITAIKAQQGEEVVFSELDWTTKCEILRSNPVTVMRMFEKRVDALRVDDSSSFVTCSTHRRSRGLLLSRRVSSQRKPTHSSAGLGKGGT